MNLFIFLNYWGKKTKNKTCRRSAYQGQQGFNRSHVCKCAAAASSFLFSFMSQLNALDVFCAQAYAYTIVSVPITGRTSEEKVEILQMSCSWVDLVVKMETASVTGEHF